MSSKAVLVERGSVLGFLVAEMLMDVLECCCAGKSSKREVQWNLTTLHMPWCSLAACKIDYWWSFWALLLDWFSDWI